MSLLVKKYMGMKQDRPVFVDWIQNTGLEYINLNYYHDSNMELRMFFEIVSIDTSTNTGDKFCGHRNGNHVNDLSFGWWQNKFDACNYYTQKDLTKFTPSTSVGKTISLALGYNVANAAIVCTMGINGSWDGTSKSQGTFQLQSPNMLLFGYYDYSIGVFKICNSGIFKIRRVTVANRRPTQYTLKELSPCIYRGEYGLWDTINNVFYGNASGQGAFIGGND